MAVTIYGFVAVTFMMVMYALESRNRRFIAGFALGCALSSSYGFLTGAWLFGVVEAVWTLVALGRYLSARPVTGPGYGSLGFTAATVASCDTQAPLDRSSNGTTALTVGRHNPLDPVDHANADTPKYPSTG